MNEITEYINQFSLEQQVRLEEIRQIIKEASPKATEKISWAMPTFYLNGNLVHFAQNKSHIGFYPGESGVACFEEKLQDYKHSKGAIQFPDNQRLPKELIQEIVRFRTQEQDK